MPVPEPFIHVDPNRLVRAILSAGWLGTDRKMVPIDGISLDNCTRHTTLDLLRHECLVFVVADASNTNSKIS